jgi:hypothetical protein
MSHSGKKISSQANVHQLLKSLYFLQIPIGQWGLDAASISEDYRITYNRESTVQQNTFAGTAVFVFCDAITPAS